jgi:hypothetical protein
VQGVVVDASAASVPGAKVTLQHRGTGNVRTVTTLQTGEFQFTAMPIGRYSLHVEAAGFSPVSIEMFFVSVGQTVFQRVEMTPAGLVEQVVVKTETEALQPTATTSNITLGYDRIELTPSQNRNYLSFVFSAPGMSPSNGSNTQRSAAGTHNATNDSGFVFAGIRGRNNSMSIDGTDNRDETTGANRVALGLEMVQEFRVSGTSVSAELGGGAGGIVNVVTRSGGNRFRGDTTFFIQNEVLNARIADVAFGRKPNYQRYQPGFMVNGPVKKDRTFFATALEGAWESGEEWSETSPQFGSLAELTFGRPFFSGVKPVRTTSGLYPAKGHDAEFSFKLNHALTSQHSFTGRYAFSRGRVENDVVGTDNFNDVSARGSSRLRDHSVVAGLVSAFSPTRVNDLRLQVAHRNAKLWPNSTGPMYEIPGVITFGQGYRLDQARTEAHYEVVDSYSALVGRHLLTAGGSIHRVNLDARLANRFGGVYLFPTVEDFAAGRPDVFSQALGRPETKISTTPVALWAQDRLQVARGLTVEIGLRYDGQEISNGGPSSNNVAPRLGVAWQPSAKAPWVFRAGAGLFFDRYLLGALNEAIQKNGSQAFEMYAAGSDAAAVFAAQRGGPVTSPPPANLNAVYTISQRFSATHASKVTAGFERGLNRDTTLAVEYSFVRGLHLPRIRNFSGRLPPQFLIEQTARSSYQGATVTVNRRMLQQFTYLLTYSAGRTRDDGSDFDEHPMDPLNVRKDWALSRQHQLHRLTASGLFEIPAGKWRAAPESLRKALTGVIVSPTYTFGSGRPLNVLDTTDSLRTGAYPISARPFNLGRNPNYSPAIKSLDLRIFKTIPVMDGRAKFFAGGESFNILNHSNMLRVSPFYAAKGEILGGYRSPIEVMNARQIQLFLVFEY